MDEFAEYEASQAVFENDEEDSAQVEYSFGTLIRVPRPHHPDSEKWQLGSF